MLKTRLEETQASEPHWLILPGIALEECEEDLPVSRLGGSGQRRHSSQRIQAVEVNAGHAH